MEVVRIKDLHEGTEEEVPKVETASDQRALGVIAVELPLLPRGER